MQDVAAIGTGLIGKSWAIVFARAGLNVRLFDADPARRQAVRGEIATDIETMAEQGLIADTREILHRIRVCESIADAVTGVGYVQESVLEYIPVKTAVCAEIDDAIGPDVIVGSSSSGIPASRFTEGLRNRERFFVVHPVNPPHLVPLVEIVPAPWSDLTLTPRLRTFMEGVGQKPIVVNREIEGFILNRLQGALLNEAWALYAEGYASLADIDLTVSHGLGARWSFMGPFETIDLNAPGGIDDYASRLGGLYHSIARSRRDPQPWPEQVIEQARTERRSVLAAERIPERQRWRDLTLMKYLAFSKTL
ncbi:MAG: 3-hydroxyacyl-CoA dehydrogenase [Sphingomonadales bacterium]